MHRNERFSKEYHEKIKNLLEVVMPYLMNKYKEMPVETHELNKSLAHFLKVMYKLNWCEKINIGLKLNYNLSKFKLKLSRN